MQDRVNVIDTIAQHAQHRADPCIRHFTAADSGDKALLVRVREIEALKDKLYKQQSAWAERKALKEKLLTISERDIRYVLAANGVEVRDGAGVLDLIGYSDKHRLVPEQ